MRPAFIFLLALLAPLWFAGAAAAQPVQPLDRLLPEIRRTHPGHFYDADGPHPGAGGSQHYHLKWMTPDGRIVWYDTDARTGRVLGVSPGRDNFDPGGRGGDRFGARGYRGYYGAPGGYGPRGFESPRGGFGGGYGGRGGYSRGGHRGH
jgi:hypothetical protein